MPGDRPAVARRIAAAAVVVIILVTAVAYAGDAPPGPPAWVSARVADTAPAVPVVPPPVPAPVMAPLAPPQINTAPAPTRAPAAPVAPARTASAPVKPLPVAPTAPAANAMSQAESQGVGCMVLGTIASASVFAYGDVIASMAGGFGQSLLAPAVAAGFAVGCNVGAILAPGVIWLTTHWH